MNPNTTSRSGLAGFFLLLCLLFSMSALMLCPSAESEKSDTGMQNMSFSTDDMVFLGESTTTHLRSRSSIRTEQVWTSTAGTLKLDSTLLSRPIIEPISGQSMTIPQAASAVKPRTLVLSFGLNGIVGFSKDPDGYLQNYRKLIAAIGEASPETEIIVQSIYPVAGPEQQTDWRFSLSPAEINRETEALNQRLLALGKEEGLFRFADTAALLQDEEGFLKPEYTTDGIHLTEAAYTEILGHLSSLKYQRSGAANGGE